MNKKDIIIIALSVLIIGSLTSLYLIKRNKNVDEGQVFCIQDAKRCPDGSFVGRIPPSCNFALCPNEQVLQNQTQQIEQRVNQINSETIQTNTIQNQTQLEASTTITSPNPSPITINFTDRGFNPETLTIKVGTAVTFINSSNKAFWPASDDHPTHSIYKEFDAKTPIAPGNIYTFTFDKVGSWNFHDHLSPNRGGTIIVNE